MGLFGTIKSGLGASPSILMIIVLGVADQLWGDSIFNCPCGEQFSRVLFTLPFLAVPPLIIITVDTPWRFVRTSCRCDLTLTCCRWMYRPVLIAIIWIVFSLLQPKFGECMFTVVSCNCTAAELTEGCNEDTVAGKEKASSTRVVAACIILGVGAILFVVGTVFTLWMCANNQCRRCCDFLCEPCRNCCDSVRKLPLVGYVFPRESQLRAHRCLTETVMAMGLKTKTIAKLQEKGLFQSSKQLASLTPDEIANMKSVSAGQQDVLRRYPKERLLIQTLIVMGLTHQTVIRLREQGIADDRLAHKLTDEDYRHISSVITKKQLKLLKQLPAKWELIQALLRSGLEAATLVLLREEGLLDEDELLSLLYIDRELRGIKYAFALEQFDMLCDYAPNLYLVLTLQKFGLTADTLTKLREHSLLHELTLYSMTESQLENLSKDVSADQFAKLETAAAKLPAYVWFVKEMKSSFDDIRKLEAKGEPQMLQIIDEITQLRALGNSVPYEYRKRIEQLTSLVIQPSPTGSPTEINDPLRPEERPIIPGIQSPPDASSANVEGTQSPSYQGPPKLEARVSDSGAGGDVIPMEDLSGSDRSRLTPEET